MKLTIEDGEDTTIADVRRISITDTGHFHVVWWETMDGWKYKYEEQERNPKRIILELEDDVFPASVNYGQRREE